MNSEVSSAKNVTWSVAARKAHSLQRGKALNRSAVVLEIKKIGHLYHRSSIHNEATARETYLETSLLWPETVPYGIARFHHKVLLRSTSLSCRRSYHDVVTLELKIKCLCFHLKEVTHLIARGSQKIDKVHSKALVYSSQYQL